MSKEDEARNTSAPGVWPGLGYQDARAGLRFLTEVLGFTESLTVDGDQGRIEHAELLWPEGGGVMFGSLGPKDTPGTAGVYVVTADPDSVHERAVEAGATVRHAPYDTDYGSRNVTLLDPEGNSWTFGTYAGAAATSSSTDPRT